MLGSVVHPGASETCRRDGMPPPLAMKSRHEATQNGSVSHDIPTLEFAPRAGTVKCRKMRSISTEEGKKPVLHPVRCRSNIWIHVGHLPNDASHVIEKGLLPIPHLFGGDPLSRPFPFCFRPLVNSIRIESGHHLVDEKSKLKDVRGFVRMICGLFPPPLPLFRTYVEMGCQLFAMRSHYGTQPLLSTSRAIPQSAIFTLFPSKSTFEGFRSW